MMRYLFLASIVLLLSPVSPAFAETPDGTSFVDFAMRAGDGLDARSPAAGGTPSRGFRPSDGDPVAP